MTVKQYPLVFSFRDLIKGKGFVAGVAMDGRVLLVEEDDGDVWMFGVHPGAIAGGNHTRDAAFAEFKRQYLGVLFDIAAEATTFQEFEREVTELFNTVNKPSLIEWEKALAEVRATSASLNALPTVKSESKTPRLYIQKIETEEAEPRNEFDEISEAA